MVSNFFISIIRRIFLNYFDKGLLLNVKKYKKKIEKRIL